MSIDKLSDDIFDSPDLCEQDNSIRIINIKKCLSTQDLLLNWFQQIKFPLNFTPVLYTDEQMAGKGQKNKTWLSDTGSLTFSLILPTSPKPSWTSLEMAVLVRDFFINNYQIETYLKWPNDLMTLQGKKVAGILCHALKDHVVVGIGINLWQVQNTNNVEFERGYIFLDRQDKLKILSKLALSLLQNRFHDIEVLKTAWLKGCIHLDKNIHWHLDGKTEVGIFRSLGTFGEAIIQLKSGQMINTPNGSLTLD